MIKMLHEPHSCIRPPDNKNCNATTKWVANKLTDMIASDPIISYELMHSEMSKQWGGLIYLYGSYIGLGIRLKRNIKVHIVGHLEF